MMNAFAISIFFSYVVLCCFFVYYCIYSYPDDSEIARFVQVNMPTMLWSRLQHIFGTKFTLVAKHVSDRLLVLAYFVIVGGCWSIVFGRLYPWLLFDCPDLSNVHGIIGVIVFGACFSAWAVANTSRPGKISVRNFRRYDHYPYDHLLFQSDIRCETTKLIKIPRSKFDRIKYDCLIPRYDHYCGWTHNTYGEENYRWFIMFLSQHVIMCYYGTYVSYLLFTHEIKTKRLMELTFFDRLTGEKIKANRAIIFQYLFARRMLEVSLMIVMPIMALALSCFLGYHVYITSIGQTTNENSKWADVKRWYKQQQKLSRSMVAKNNNTTDNAGSSSSAPSTTDQMRQEQPISSKEREIIDPGPVPKNIYSRGFFENWKEVFFPLSLRNDSYSRGGYTKEFPSNKEQNIISSQNGEGPTRRNNSENDQLQFATNTTKTNNRCSKPKDV